MLKNKKVITEKFSIKKIDFYKEILSVLVKLLKINNENDFIRVSRALLRIMKPDNTIIGIEMRDAGSMLKLKTKKKK
ncbi:MAG TPA: hypothetical protein PK605_07995 [Ignavibacteria bacterium]|nr:hypothetical protein [Ignavibacteria bacterium]HRJ04330.1 hypothetical protein [Ignavibacteria bacterium]